jgi:hypothetical protein
MFFTIYMDSTVLNIFQWTFIRIPATYRYYYQHYLEAQSELCKKETTNPHRMKTMCNFHNQASPESQAHDTSHFFDLSEPTRSNHQLNLDKQTLLQALMRKKSPQTFNHTRERHRMPLTCLGGSWSSATRARESCASSLHAHNGPRLQQRRWRPVRHVTKASCKPDQRAVMRIHTTKYDHSGSPKNFRA